MIVGGTFTYKVDDQVKKLSAEEYARLRTVMKNLPENQEEYKSHTLGYEKFIFNVDELSVITSVGLTFEIEKTPHKSLAPLGMGSTASPNIKSIVPRLSW